MNGITSVQTTGLFWETLEAGGRRNHKRYWDIRATIEGLAIRKAFDLGPVSKRDSRFASTNKHLSGIWHCTLAWEPDTVLFYTIKDRVLSLAMIGSHQDYPHAKGNLSVAERTATKIHAAVAAGQVASPGWRTLHWRRPADLIHHPELHEASPKLLIELTAILRVEADDACIFKRVHGSSLTDADEKTFNQWFEEVEAAHEAINAVMASRPVTGEERLAYLVENGSPWARAV